MSKTIDVLINELLQYALDKKLISFWDLDYSRNMIIAQLGISEIDTDMSEVYGVDVTDPSQFLDPILDWAYENGHFKMNTVTERDLLDTKIMGCLTARPSEVIREFRTIEKEEGTEVATKWFYEFSKNNHYIRQDRIKKNVSWNVATEYGDLEITINLSKPEKDPKEIAAVKQVEESHYPLCLLCKENEGYAGRLNHPARQNLRTIPVHLQHQEWKLQFSPYVYYNEHAIVFSSKHEPMKISELTFKRLLDFVERFPHYFVGSNADLPIVGGSILSHDHYQGGHHEFPMALAEEFVYDVPSLKRVQIGKVKWAMSVLRVTGKEKEDVVNAAEYIRTKWQTYSDPSVEIHSHTGDTPHNTVTPIGRMKDGHFQLDIVLRNNRTNEEHPMGIFHPHGEVHHIKRENIGLIEVMGLAVLPGRLVEEMNLVGAAIVSDNMREAFQNDDIAKHKEWAEKIVLKYGDINSENYEEILHLELGQTFATILEHAGVFKKDKLGQDAFDQFISSL